MPQVFAAPLSEIAEPELVVRCQQGDKLAFRLLYQRYQQKVRATLYQLCGKQSLDDLVQEVFLKVWQGLPKLRQPLYFSTWLYRISWNVAKDKRRKFSKQRQERLTQAQNNLLNHHLLNSEHNSPLNRLHYQDLVQRGLQTLNLEQRAVLVLHDLEDLPQREVAQVLDIPVGTVKSRLFRARRVMRKFLQAQGALL